MCCICWPRPYFGAQRFDRIEIVRKGTIVFALSFGVVAAGAFLVIARPLAGLFSQNPHVIDVLVQYMYVTCFGYGFLEVHRYAGFYMIGIHKPVSAAVLNIIRVIVLLIPLSFIGAGVFGLISVFWGRLLTDILAGGIGIIWSKRIMRSIQKSV